MLFSERQGFKPVRQQLQIDSIDEALKNALWNVLYSFLYTTLRQPSNLSQTLYVRIWVDFFKKTIDTIPAVYGGEIDRREIIGLVKSKFFSNKNEWYYPYDLIDFVALYSAEDFMESMNSALKREMSAYRFIDKKLVQVTSEEEIEEIEGALQITEDKYKPVNQHLKAALTKLSDREKPDYRNSIKESISAVESLCKKITGDDKATLGEALKKLKKADQLHLALTEAFLKLYGYTSDEGGIRHALIDDAKDIDFAEAKFMLVTCTAFVNFLISRAETTI